MTAFEFTPPGGEPLARGQRRRPPRLLDADPRDLRGRRDVRRGAHRRPARRLRGRGVGGIALLLFLILDLPDAGKLGDLEDPIRGFASAKAEPQEGFWLEAIGATILALAGAAFATLTPSQLRALGTARRRKRAKPAGTTHDARAAKP